MYTVAELIEALKQCPQDYPVMLNAPCEKAELETIGINHQTGTVDLFPSQQ